MRIKPEWVVGVEEKTPPENEWLNDVLRKAGLLK